MNYDWYQNKQIWYIWITPRTLVISSTNLTKVFWLLDNRAQQAGWVNKCYKMHLTGYTL